MDHFSIGFVATKPLCLTILSCAALWASLTLVGEVSCCPSSLSVRSRKISKSYHTSIPPLYSDVPVSEVCVCISIEVRLVSLSVTTSASHWSYGVNSFPKSISRPLRIFSCNIFTCIHTISMSLALFFDRTTVLRTFAICGTQVCVNACIRLLWGMTLFRNNAQKSNT